MERECEHCGDIWNTTMGVKSCQNPFCTEKQGDEIQCLKAENKELKEENENLHEALERAYKLSGSRLLKTSNLFEKLSNIVDEYHNQFPP